jgi:hypothetical protein
MSALSSRHFFAVAIIALALLSGCATPRKFEPYNDPFLRANGGPLVIVDTCVFQDAVGDADDYFLAPESLAGGERVMDAAVDFLRESGVAPKATLVPYACGVLGENGNELQLVRLDAGLPASMEPRPFLTHPSLAGNAAVIEALHVLASTTWDRGVRDNMPALTQGRQMGPAVSKSFTAEQIRAAAAVIQKVFQADSMIYIAIQGYSQSGGKAAMAHAGRFLVALATGLTTGVAIIPGGVTDGSVKTAVAFDLATGTVQRSAAIRGMGDPRKPDVVSDKRFVRGLLNGLLNREVVAAK